MKRIDPLPDVPTFDEIRIQEPGGRQLVRHRRAGGHTPRKFSPSTRFGSKAAPQDPEAKAKSALQGLHPVGICGDEFGADIRNASTIMAR